MREWQLIETAPKDGTRMLGSRLDGPVRVTWYDEDHETWATFMRGNPPSHWMPLPDPPSSRERGDA